MPARRNATDKGTAIPALTARRASAGEAHCAKAGALDAASAKAAMKIKRRSDESIQIMLSLLTWQPE